MRDWTISATGIEPVSARWLASQTYPSLGRNEPRPATYLITGSAQAQIAACAEAALATGHRVVLLPGGSAQLRCLAPAGTLLQVEPHSTITDQIPGSPVRSGWHVAMHSSGSTAGCPRGYGFTTAQLDIVTSWYEAIYQATSDTIIVTALPTAYNFAFVAGVLLAARLSARLHLSSGHQHVLADAAVLARSADRVIVLANPVILDQATLSGRMPANVLVDSGGAPLSTAAIGDYRAHGIDLREGYGLTETASLTHFDVEADTASLGTVGHALPGTHASITRRNSKPLIQLTSPAIGIPLDPAQPLPGPVIRTTDLGHIDQHGRLRLLGRDDDEQINRLWPRDTLDALGPVLGRRCALIRHHADQVKIRLLRNPSQEIRTALRCRAADLLELPLRQVDVSHHGSKPLLHSAKLTRHASRQGDR